MQKLSILAFAAAASILSVQAFVPITPSYTSQNVVRYFHSPTYKRITLSSLFSTESSSQETDAERMLRRARELLAEASAEEETLRASLIDKKHDQNIQLDKTIAELFPSGPSTPTTTLVAQLRQKHLSTDKLIRLIERLHEREVAAKGLHHVEQTSTTDHTKFQVVSSNEVNKAELARIEGLIDNIIDAASFLDEEWRQEKKNRNDKHLHYAEKVHWTAGNVADELKHKARELRREHDDQFKKRQSEYYEAARKKKKDEKDLKP
mmetsp:Transcript_3657/g.5557  ORF Transcript_3657/g.5557 Transcript_3657/m.5557 type:complete len:264 (-) Transcript_3657:376-1167(-)